jgi:hypothetical protein
MSLGAMPGGAESSPTTGGEQCGIRVNRILCAVALAAAPVTAHANVGIGYFMPALPLILLALAPAILVEACVLAPLLPVPLPRALRLSLIANLQSTLWGFVLGIAVDVALVALSGSMGPDPNRASMIAALVPMFFLTWRVEYKAIECRLTELSRWRVAAASGAANLVSYAAMIVCAWMLLPAHGSFELNRRVTEAILAGSGARVAVEGYYQSAGRLPKSSEEAGFPRDAAPSNKLVLSIEIKEKGVVLVRLAKNEYWPEGGEIRLTPGVDAKTKTFKWTCRSTLPPKGLPVMCRE